MREIKFRAWDKKHHLMYSDGLYICLDGVLFDAINGELDSLVPDVELMQYTGLKDKNGIEIYEGDILSNSDYDSWWNCEVVYKDGGFWTSEYELLFTTLEDNNCQVIGNVWENKELLKD